MYFAILKFVSIVLTALCVPFWVFSLLVTTLHDEPQGNFEVGVVLGASVLADGQPSYVLQKRLDKAVELFESNQIQLILVSGDNRSADYNEPQAMKNYLTAKNIPFDKVLEDFGGSRTIDTCWRARNVFKLNRVTLITQPFHLPRSSYLCQSVGLKVRTAEAEDSSSHEAFYYSLLRELPASWLALKESRDYEPPDRSNLENIWR